MRKFDDLFATLAKSAFRRKFHLQGKDLEYRHNKSLPPLSAMPTILFVNV
jgi:hypothetical protein